ncbi:hypothetical protein D9M71_799290 [compost metagenome]
MNKFKVRIEHHDSWSVEDNYTVYKMFDSEQEAKEFVEFKMKPRYGSAPEYYENCYYEGVVK